MFEEKEKNNKKPLIVLSIVTGLLLVALVAVSYAAFTANLTGVKQNKLTTGYVLMNCSETNFTLSNTQPLTDEQGIALQNNEATCTLTTTITGTMNIGYDFALANVTPSSTITAADVKIRASKTENSNTTYVQGTATEGVLLSTIASTGGQYDTSITGYKVDSGTVNTSKTITYNVKSWVASEQTGENTTTNTDGYCSDETKTTKAACEDAGEVWGYNQKSSQAGGTFSFKLKVGAKQIYS